MIDNSFLRKGIMTEALKTIFNYGFEKMQLHRIEALVGPNNIASLTLLENFGFKKEGQLREHYFINDKMEDSVIYSLLKKEMIK